MFDDLLNFDVSGANVNKATVRDLIKNSPDFNKFLQHDPHANLIANANRYGAAKAHEDFLGADGSRVSHILDLMEENNEITPEEKTLLAADLKDANDQLTGKYQRIDNKGYNWLLNSVSFLTMISSLGLAPVASIPEIATLIFHRNPQAFGTLKEFTKTFFKEVAASANEIATKLSGGRIPMAQYTHREALRKQGYLLESQGAAARAGAEISPGRAHMAQMFFKITGLTALTNAQRATALMMSDTVIESWVDQAVLHKDKNNALYQEAYEALLDLGVDPEFMVGYKENYHGISEVNPDLAGNLDDQYNAMLDIAKRKFTDQHITNPLKLNRPKFYSDPRFRLVTMFKGFISTFTSTILKIMGQDVVQGSNAARKRALTAASGMIALAFFSNALRSSLKGQERDEDEWEKFKRALMQSGVPGVFGLPVELLFNARRSETGRLISEKGSVFSQAADAAAAISPQLGYVDKAIGAVESAASGSANTDRDIAKLTPVNPFKDIFERLQYEKEKR